MIAMLLAPAAAQDRGAARLTVGVAVGRIGGTALWDVATQTIRSAFAGPDIFHLHRDIGSGVTLSGHATYFGGAHVGFTGEFTHLGLDGADRCDLVQDGGDSGLAAACAAIPASPSSGATTTVQGGIVLQPLASAAFRPYLKGLAGIAFTPGSTVAMQSRYNGNNVLTIYQDDQPHPMRPTWTAAGGIAASLKPGYAVVVEVRETWLAQAAVTGATPAQGFAPPSRLSVKRFPSAFVGFDVVLEQRRGRAH